jgi:hypothetical protein
MSGTTVGIVLIVVVAVATIAIWLGSVYLASRRPGSKNPKRERMRGLVQGGQHVGGGRSVMPTRDAPVPPGGGEPPSPEQEDATQAGPPVRRSGSPMDL